MSSNKIIIWAIGLLFTLPLSISFAILSIAKNIIPLIWISMIISGSILLASIILFLIYAKKRKLEKEYLVNHSNTKSQNRSIKNYSSDSQEGLIESYNDAIKNLYILIDEANLSVKMKAQLRRIYKEKFNIEHHLHGGQSISFVLNLVYGTVKKELFDEILRLEGKDEFIAKTQYIFVNSSDDDDDFDYDLSKRDSWIDED